MHNVEVTVYGALRVALHSTPAQLRMGCVCTMWICICASALCWLQSAVWQCWVGNWFMATQPLSFADCNISSICMCQRALRAANVANAALARMLVMEDIGFHGAIGRFSFAQFSSANRLTPWNSKWGLSAANISQTPFRPSPHQCISERMFTSANGSEELCGTQTREFFSSSRSRPSTCHY